jgi:hypothetical protein
MQCVVLAEIDYFATYAATVDVLEPAYCAAYNARRDEQTEMNEARDLYARLWDQCIYGHDDEACAAAEAQYQVYLDEKAEFLAAHQVAVNALAAINAARNAAQLQFELDVLACCDE